VEEILIQLLIRPVPSQKELAYRLSISPGTLKAHLNRVYALLGFGGPGSMVRTIAWVEAHPFLLLDSPRQLMPAPKSWI
jgi:DNA-binding NarL/FixJ family response regulator